VNDWFAFILNFLVRENSFRSWSPPKMCVFEGFLIKSKFYVNFACACESCWFRKLEFYIFFRSFAELKGSIRKSSLLRSRSSNFWGLVVGLPKFKWERLLSPKSNWLKCSDIFYCLR